MAVRMKRCNLLITAGFLVLFSGCGVLEDVGLLDGKSEESTGEVLSFDVVEPLRIIGAQNRSHPI